MHINKTLIYLLYFCVYAAALLVAGKGHFRDSNTISKFYVGERKMSVAQCMLTFTGTWVSAATVLGFTGSVYESGYQPLMYSVIPWFVGAVLLYFISDRLYQNDILTIPEFFYKRYHSRWLRVIYASITILVYVLYLVIQIKGFGLVFSNLFGIPYGIAILMIYLFILYATFGGYRSVVRTDIFNLLALSVGLIIIYAVIVGRAGGMPAIFEKVAGISGFAHQGAAYANEPGDMLRLFGKGKFTPVMSATMFFGWGLGLAANPQYMVRMISARDQKASRHSILWSLVYLTCLYFALVVIGLGMRAMYPSLPSVSNTDDIFVHIINNQLYSPLSGFFLFTIIGACVSTANSQLLLIASSFSYDIVHTVSRRPLNERTLLNLSRISILVGGTVSLLLSVNPPSSLLSYGGDIWGIFSATLFPSLYGSLYSSKITRQGIWACLISGLAGIAVFYPLYYGGVMPIHPAFPATVLSCLCLWIVSRRTGERSETCAR